MIKFLILAALAIALAIFHGPKGPRLAGPESLATPAPPSTAPSATPGTAPGARPESLACDVSVFWSLPPTPHNIFGVLACHKANAGPNGEPPPYDLCPPAGSEWEPVFNNSVCYWVNYGGTAPAPTASPTPPAYPAPP